jgi:hypothetical protein
MLRKVLDIQPQKSHGPIINGVCFGSLSAKDITDFDKFLGCFSLPLAKTSLALAAAISCQIIQKLFSQLLVVRAAFLLGVETFYSTRMPHFLAVTRIRGFP